jgi:hypothetical protein
MTAILSIAFQTVKFNTNEATVYGDFPGGTDLRPVLGKMDEGILGFQPEADGYPAGRDEAPQLSLSLRP